MNARWKPNDKALCVRVQPWLLGDIEVTETEGVPVWGQIYHVIDFSYQGGDIPALALTGFDAWWDSAEFIRIEPASVRLARETKATQSSPSHPTSLSEFNAFLAECRERIKNLPFDGTLYGPDGFPVDPDTL